MFQNLLDIGPTANLVYAVFGHVLLCVLVLIKRRGAANCPHEFHRLVLPCPRTSIPLQVLHVSALWVGAFSDIKPPTLQAKNIDIGRCHGASFGCNNVTSILPSLLCVEHAILYTQRKKGPTEDRTRVTRFKV